MILVAVALWLGTVGVAAQLRHPSLLRNHPAIKYESSTAADPVAELNRKLASGEVTLEPSSSPSGYLASVLEALNVPVESQMLVFSKTSFQAPRINPKNPRAIFFNDTVSVGWVRGGEVLEFIGQDPQLGENHRQWKTGKAMTIEEAIENLNLALA
ncbi:hypothetical protein D3C83_19510 [compost metagenome]